MTLHRSDFAYDLPVELIAQEPAADRAGSRLLVLDAAGPLQHRQFRDIALFLAAGDLLVVNDTRVVPARLRARKDSGGDVELLLERIEDDRTALFQARASKPLKPERTLCIVRGDGALIAPPIVLVRRAGEF
jgi:S-adenosylmethionine:tRNA ribosyltransferase-isomerase